MGWWVSVRVNGCADVTRIYLVFFGGFFRGRG